MADPTTVAQQMAGATSIVPDPYRFDQDGRPTGLVFSQNPQSAYSWHHRLRKGPSKPVAQDPTIGEVMLHQEDHIANMIQAVYNLEGVRDNIKFDGLRLPIRGGDDSVDEPDVEGASRCLFQKIIDYCHNGCCCPGKDNAKYNAKYNAKDIDKALTCEAQVDEAIKALHIWKSVCKNVVFGDDKIEDFASGPITYCAIKGPHLEEQ
jgi:hypothetical protein